MAVNKMKIYKRQLKKSYKKLKKLEREKVTLSPIGYSFAKSNMLINIGWLENELRKMKERKNK